MRLKRYARYQINFPGKCVTLSGALVGLSVFLRMLYFFGLHLISDFEANTIVFRLALPVFVSLVYIYLLNGIRWNAPGVYGILGSVFCLMLIGWNLTSGDILRIVLSVCGYLVAALILLATTGGFVPGRFLSFLCFAVLIGLRVFLYDRGGLALSDWITECADLCLIAALSVFSFCLIPGKMHHPEDPLL